MHQHPSQELRSKLQAETFRLVHVDGSHLYEIVKEDIETARAVLGDGGVVIFDDYRALHAPGVAAAVWQACADVHLPLVPLVLSDAKLYGTFSAHLGVDLRRQLQASTISFDVIPRGGSDVLRVRSTSTSRSTARQRIVRALTPPAVHSISRRLRRVGASR